jgi:hypothetical protein
MRKQLFVYVSVLVCLAFGSIGAHAQNGAPPVGAILDLNGKIIPGGGSGNAFTQYSVDFTGAQSATAITFAFRDDPAVLLFEDVSVTDLTTSSGNLLTNGDFTGGTYTSNGNSSTPTGWTYDNFGAVIGARSVQNLCTGTDCWVDGALQAYDGLSQTISTNVGDNYRIIFYVGEDSNCGCTFSRLSTNGDVTDGGGNGIDVLAYAQKGVPTLAPTPEPSSLLMLATGLFAIAKIVRRRVPA